MDNLVSFPDYRHIYGPKPEYMGLGFGEGFKDESLYTTDSGEHDILLLTHSHMPVLCTLENANSTKIQNAVLQHCNDCSNFFLSVTSFNIKG